ncbi:hypothetical protein [Maledivibacter halophilus]|uniref:Ethanolamine utilization cobalamin adenosyltransferase n=1 Tax=Maledivibacter halophilus TaxID=36842 RepID=A0A1T5M0B9_9FIRM|nr:hypothetical protein [Maledivibacter halophilus]SKC81565.1 ethanolamine utilization cobalamin adenosyltransferase [Maledivibacter halophilus]
MKVLTEDILRRKLKEKSFDKYFITKNVIITPLAKQYLKDRGIELIIEDDLQRDEDLDISNKKIIPKYISYYLGGVFEKKPEYMTQIYGNKLVFKDDPRIIFRGKLDSLQSQIMELQILLDSQNINRLVEELEEVLNYIREILKSEVLEEELCRKKLIGLNQEELREMSHNPKKHFDIDHILPNYKMGKVLIGLNTLRCSVREAELTAVNAFKKNLEISRIDIIRGLNRLSSCIYILMCKYKAGLYK